MTPGHVTVEPVTSKNWRSALPLGVKPDQQRFIADYAPVALVILAKAYVGPGGKRWDPYLLCVDGEPWGMAAIAYVADDPRSECWIFHFFIDHRRQGQGIGSAALRAVVELIAKTRPSCRRIMLTVHPENIAAQRLYEKHGFARTSERVDGEPVYGLRLRAAPVTHSW